MWLEPAGIAGYEANGYACVWFGEEPDGGPNRRRR